MSDNVECKIKNIKFWKRATYIKGTTHREALIIFKPHEWNIQRKNIGNAWKIILKSGSIHF